MNMPELILTIEQYSDYFEFWMDCETGEYTLKVDGQPMTIEAFNKMQETD